MSNRTKPYKIIGTNTRIKVAGIPDVPAKVDTGADSSSIWASEICINPDGLLEFCLFAAGSPHYTGEKITTANFRVQKVRNSTGDVGIRYRTTLSVVIRGRRIKANFTLADRQNNNFPVLIGRKTLKNRFLVDVSIAGNQRPPKMDNHLLNAELFADPQAFHAKYLR